MNYDKDIEELNLNKQNLKEIPKEIFSLVNLKNYTYMIIKYQKFQVK